MPSEDHDMIPPWTRLPCTQCGIEGQASRSRPVRGPFVCEGCIEAEKHAGEIAKLTGELEAEKIAHELTKSRLLAEQQKSHRLMAVWQAASNLAVDHITQFEAGGWDAQADPKARLEELVAVVQSTADLAPGSVSPGPSWVESLEALQKEFPKFSVWRRADSDGVYIVIDHPKLKLFNWEMRDNEGVVLLHHGGELYVTTVDRMRARFHMLWSPSCST